MAQWHYEACPDESCGSSDAFAHKDGDEFGQCFSCGKRFRLATEESVPTPRKKMTKAKTLHTLPVEEIGTYEVRGFQERNIRKNVAQHYGVRVAYDVEGNISSHFYPYTKNGVVVAYKERQLPKKFIVHGKFAEVELFGQNVAGSGGKRIVITEGEIDAMAVAQSQFDKYSKFYPVVSITSASGTKTLLEQRTWLRTFDEVILMLDNDEPGKKATEEAAKIIGFDKVKIAKLPAKDASDTLLMDNGSELLMHAVFNATSYSPAGVVCGEEIWKQFKDRLATESIPYPTCLKGSIS